MPAVFAFLIGVAAGDVPQWVQPDDALPVEAEADLSPALNGAPSDRRGGNASRIADDETVGNLPPGATGTVTIERRIIIRIPTLRPPPPPGAPAFVPKFAPASPVRPRATCVTLRSLKGASFQDKAGVVFVTNGDERYRAVLERGCRPVDFQSGFYLSPSADGAICAGRDMLHARSGLKCTITGLTRLSSGM